MASRQTTALSSPTASQTPTAAKRLTLKSPQSNQASGISSFVLIRPDTTVKSNAATAKIKNASIVPTPFTRCPTNLLQQLTDETTRLVVSCLIFTNFLPPRCLTNLQQPDGSATAERIRDQRQHEQAGLSVRQQLRGELFREHEERIHYEKRIRWKACSMQEYLLLRRNIL